MPGPGKYEQKRLFDDVGRKQQSDLLGLEIERPPFGTQSKVIYKLDIVNRFKYQT